MKIIYGKYKGRNIIGPQNKATRPTLQRAKETMFNIIPHNLKPGIVVDIFAGSGQLGLEALSRGATFLIANETNPKALQSLHQNLKFLPSDDYQITKVDYLNFFNHIKNRKIDYVFVDPPYDFALEAIKKTLEIIDQNDLLNKKGFVIGEIPTEEKLDFTLTNLKLKKIHPFSKTTKIWIYEKK